MENIRIYVEKEDIGKRIDSFLSNELDFSRNKVQIIIEKGLVRNQFHVIDKSSYIIKAEEALSVEIEEPVEIDIIPQNIPINIMFQDEDIVVINKSKGMVVHPGAGNLENTLVNALLYHIKDLSSINGKIRPGIVHRLDKDTSGIIVVAKNDFAHNSLAKQFSDRRVNKQYIGIADGFFHEKMGIIERPIARSRKNRQTMAVVSSGRYAKTSFNVIEGYKDYSLINYQIYTGRTHQIRVHSQSIGHPIVGDLTYGGSNKFQVNGQLLHSWYLGITHPTTGKDLSFIAPPPDDFLEVLVCLRQNSLIYINHNDPLLFDLLDIKV
ncbi:MAG: RluA family pseudouridine synthase [Clostridia bacterium]